MKKIVLTVVAVGLGVVAAHAQNVADARFFSESLACLGPQCKVTQTTKPSSDNKLGKQEKKANDALTKAIEAQAVEQAKKATQNTQEAQTKDSFPYYYYGREGHAMLVGSGYGKSEQKAAPTKKAKKGSCLSRILGFAKYENETDEEWQARLYAMAMK